MNFPYFIAKRFSFSQTGRRISMRPGIKIATFGIAVGLAVMLIAFSVVVGFKDAVGDQVIGFSSHIQVFEYSSSNSFEKRPIDISTETLKQLSDIQNVRQIGQVATKPGIIKTETDFKGVVFKGVGANYSWDFFKKNLFDGSIIDFSNPENSNKVIISKSLAETLKLKKGDNFFAYFFQQQVRALKFTIEAIYSTTFSDFDNLFVICDLKQIQRLNEWDSTQISSLEISLADFSKLNKTTSKVRAVMGNKFNNDRLLYNTMTIKQLYPQIFNWLDMLDINAWIILVLMMAVAGFNMISGLLILILERTQTIGLFKALGSKNSRLRKIFLFQAMFFVSKGMLWGNITGLGIIVLQHFTHIIELNPEYYYVNYVPVSISLPTIVLLNVGVFVISILMLLLPSHIITKISPAKAIRFE
ncbi:MAG: ABC transporter permease [Prevotellaceae bacterium]|nr:ABC transporter permease [Prevotellaceae bacterium]